jgi:hypothetical protein
MDGNLTELLRKHLPDGFYQRIESSTGLGIPDLFFAFDNQVNGWIEFKLARGNIVVIRPQQIAWLERASRLGCRCFLLVRRRRKVTDELFLFFGSAARTLAIEGLAAVTPLYYDHGGPAKWDFKQLRKELNRVHA